MRCGFASFSKARLGLSARAIASPREWLDKPAAFVPAPELRHARNKPTLPAPHFNGGFRGGFSKRSCTRRPGATKPLLIVRAASAATATAATAHRGHPGRHCVTAAPRHREYGDAPLRRMTLRALHRRGCLGHRAALFELVTTGRAEILVNGHAASILISREPRSGAGCNPKYRMTQSNRAAHAAGGYRASTGRPAP